MSIYFIQIFAFIITTSILVAFHEYGHYKIARLCNVKVLNFSIGFGPKLFKRTSKSGTEYSLSAIPLGGYVKMLDEREAQVADGELSYAFNRKSPWQKLAIVLAGPLFNFLLAFIAFYGVYLYGIVVERPVIQYIEPSSIAEQAGIKANQEILSIDNTSVASLEDLHMALAARLGTSGDLLIATKNFSADAANSAESNNQKINNYKLVLNNWQTDINKAPITNSLGIWMLPKDNNYLKISKIEPANGAQLAGLKIGDIITRYNNNKITKFDDFLAFVKNHPNTSLDLTLLRNNVEQNVTITIGSHFDNTKNMTTGFLGISFNYPFYLTVQNYGFIESLSKAFTKTVYYIYQTFYMIYKLIVGQLGLDTVRGPIMVGQAAGMQIQMGMSNFLDFLAVISIGLGVINLLPIPVLDGGHVVYHLYELLTGKQASTIAENIGVIVGALCLLLIMGIAFYNDIIYW